MRLVDVAGVVYLEHGCDRVPLDQTDLAFLRKMTPLGRKVHFRKKSRDLRVTGGDPSADIILDWYNLPAREWNFPLKAEIKSGSAGACPDPSCPAAF